MLARRNHQMTVDDFLALDHENLDQNYEFIDGQMLAMAGASVNHGTIIGNIMVLIRLHFRNMPCRVLVENFLKIGDKCPIPDIMVTCNAKDIEENKTYIEHPSLVIEVLSPSTEKRDRTVKSVLYGTCLSIQEYVLIGWDEKCVQKKTRQVPETEACWKDTWYYPGDSLKLETIGLTIPVDVIYENITLPIRKLPRRSRKKDVQ